MSTTPDTGLEVRAVSCYRNNRLLLDKVNFCVLPGEIVQIVGKNGSGKTTLLRIMMGLIPIASGEILYDGESMTENKDNFYRNLFYLGHQIGIKAELTVKENLIFSWRMNANRNEIEIVLDRLELLAYQDQPCRYLSRGQCQRVALAQLILSQAKWWFLDEPFCALDQKAQLLMQALFDEKCKKGGGIVFSSHQALLISKLPVRMVDLERFRVVATAL